MVLIVFLIDTSASMNQKTCLGTTYLDIAKGAVESFLKIRARDQANRQDRYMLVTFDEPPNCIKSGWKENPATFNEELKTLQASSVSCVGPALKETFDLLNMHRLHTGIDNYGMGRNPYYFESSLIIAITDGCMMTDANGVLSELHLPMHNQMAGSELTREPFRWDQRMFSLLLRIPGHSYGRLEKQSNFQVEDAAITPMCEVTGGKSYLVTTHKMLMQSLESIAQKIQPGVVINFEKFGGDPEPIVREGSRTPGNSTPKVDDEASEKEEKSSVEPHINGLIPLFDSNRQFQPIKSEGQNTGARQVPESPVRGDHVVPGTDGEQQAESERNTESPLALSTSWHSTRKMIFVRTVPKGSGGHWPIPESFWPDPGAHSLPQRDAHPIIKFSCANAEPMVIENLPFDKYELEPSPLTQYILERKQPNVCWQAFVSGSGRDSSELGLPFGYLKASSNLQSVNFFVMPYNYPVLLPLLDELFKVHKLKPIPKWRQNFEHYLSAMPSYYAGHLRNALRRMGAPMNLVPDHIDGSLSFSIVTYLKKIKQQAKMESDRLVNLVSKKPIREIQQYVPSVPQLVNERQKDYRQILLRNASTVSPDNSDNNQTEEIMNIGMFSGVASLGLPFLAEAVPVQSYRNPFDIPRRNMVKHLKRMRANLFHFSPSSAKLQDEDAKHSVSIAQMGNYQEYLRNFAPLREVDPGQARVHTFGNPFKIKQDQFLAIDEADFNEAIGSPGQSPSRKRPQEASSVGSKRRKRSETPPPSRRPVGPPNTPPPNIVLTSASYSNENEDPKHEHTKAGFQLVKEDTKESYMDADSRLEERVIENGLVTEEKRSSTKLMSQQLKKLQDLHRGKQPKGDKVELVNGQISSHNEESTSPIVSILRTSLVDSEDKTSTEEEKNDFKHSKILNGGGNSMDSEEYVKAKVEVLVNNAPTVSLDDESVRRRCRHQLQQGSCTVLRLQAWKVLRGSRDAQEIIELVEKVSGPPETKYFFVLDIIEEAEKFRLNSLVSSLKTFSKSLYPAQAFLSSS